MVLATAQLPIPPPSMVLATAQPPIPPPSMVLATAQLPIPPPSMVLATASLQLHFMSPIPPSLGRLVHASSVEPVRCYSAGANTTLVKVRSCVWSNRQA